MFVPIIGFLSTSNHTGMFSNENRNNGPGFSNIVSIPENNIGPNIRIPSPGNPSAYFAPISPAAKTSHIEDLADSSSSKNPLMDMLRVGSSSTHEDHESEGKMLSNIRYSMKCRFIQRYHRNFVS